MADRITPADIASAHYRHISQQYQWRGLTRLLSTHNLTHVLMPNAGGAAGLKPLILLQ
jgi:hypothetical protein